MGRPEETFEELLRAVRGDEDLEALARDANVSLFTLRQIKNGLATQPQMVKVQCLATALRVPFKRVDDAIRVNRHQRDPRLGRRQSAWRPNHRRAPGETLRLERLINGVFAVIEISDYQLRERWDIDAPSPNKVPAAVLRTLEADAAIELAEAAAAGGQHWLVDFDALPRASRITPGRRDAGPKQPSFASLTQLAVAMGVRKADVARRLAVSAAELRALDLGCATLPEPSCGNAAKRIGGPCDDDMVRLTVAAAQKRGGPSGAMLERIRALATAYAQTPFEHRAQLIHRHFPDALERGQVSGPDRDKQFYWKPVSVHISRPAENSAH